MNIVSVKHISNIKTETVFQSIINKMHKSASKKNQELSIVQAVDNYLFKKTEKLKFYNQCKKTTRQKLNVVNLGMLFFL